jgi:hypothetical protein
MKVTLAPIFLLYIKYDMSQSNLKNLTEDILEFLELPKLLHIKRQSQDIALNVYTTNAAANDKTKSRLMICPKQFPQFFSGVIQTRLENEENFLLFFSPILHAFQTFGGYQKCG